MDFIWKKLRDFSRIYENVRAEEKKREISKFEGYLQMAYKVLSWEDNSLTLIVFLVLNFIFWLVIQFEIKLFGVLFLILLGIFVTDFFFGTNLNTQPSPHYDAIEELYADITDFLISLQMCRRNNPSWFTIWISLVFLTLSFISAYFSGSMLVYLTLLVMFFTPLLVGQLPEHHYYNIRQFMRTFGSDQGVLAEEELIPFISDKDFNQRDPDLDSLLTNRTAESRNNSLISDLMTMPSHLDLEDRESLQEDDLLPPGSSSRTADDLSSDSDSDHKGIRFESCHFNGDSSSEEENRYEKDLNFASDAIDNAAASGGAIAVASASMLSAVLDVDAFREAASTYTSKIYDALVTNNPGNNKQKQDSSDSEFEIINSDEIDDEH